jgi:hypothetical protein
VSENATKVYVATINVPGYLPMDDEPPTFESAADAWTYLRDERDHGLDAAYVDDDETADRAYEELCEMLARSINDGGPWDGTGTVYGDTPGYGGDHDLGLAYSVTLVDTADLA